MRLALGRVEDSIAGAWVFVISKTKLTCALVIPFATKGAVLAVEAFTFCVGLAWLARCVLPLRLALPESNDAALAR